MDFYEIEDVNVAKKYAAQEKNLYEFEYRGYPCVVKRIPNLGHLCGYIKATDADIREAAEYHFHGGITYDEEGVIGLDCAHYMDMTNLDMVDEGLNFGGTYKTINYVERNLKETIDLALDK